MTSALLHCVCGPIAAGKSTRARALADEVQGVRFAIDEWMQALYGPERPPQWDMAWLATRLARCHALIDGLAGQVLARGRDVVLEAGLGTRAERDAFRARAAAAGHRLRWHFVDAPRELRQARVVQRNQARGETFSFEITPAMFDYMETRYEPPGSDELGQG